MHLIDSKENKQNPESQESLHDCGHDEDTFCPGSGSLDVAAVVCVEEQADLEPDIYDLMSSAHLEDKQLFFLQVC